MNIKGENLEMYEEAREFFIALPSPLDILEGRVDLEESCSGLSTGQKAILLPFLAKEIHGRMKELTGDQKIPSDIGQNLFAFLNYYCSWQERVGFTHMVSLLLEGSFSLFKSSDAMTKFAETTRAYVQGSL